MNSKYAIAFGIVLSLNACGQRPSTVSAQLGRLQAAEMASDETDANQESFVTEGEVAAILDDSAKTASSNSRDVATEGSTFSSNQVADGLSQAAAAQQVDLSPEHANNISTALLNTANKSAEGNTSEMTASVNALCKQVQNAKQNAAVGQAKANANAAGKAKLGKAGVAKLLDLLKKLFAAAKKAKVAAAGPNAANKAKQNGDQAAKNNFVESSPEEMNGVLSEMVGILAK